MTEATNQAPTGTPEPTPTAIPKESTDKWPAIPVPQREKYWEEKDDAQRIQALRDVVYAQVLTILKMQEAIDLLMRHGHGGKGGELIVVNIHDPRNAEKNYHGDPMWSIKTKYERERSFD